VPPIANPNIWDTINSISYISITLIGTILAFKANGGGAGTDFLGRLYSIGFVVGVRLLIPMCLVIIFYGMFAFSEVEEIVQTPMGLLLEFLLYSFLYWRIVKHIGDV